MPAYDPDDSDDVDDGPDEYTTTNVLLGYASQEPTGDDISHLGGVPNCQKSMPLLLQLNGDLPDRFPGHERRLWIFGCRAVGCARKKGSVRVVRGVRSSSLTEEGRGGRGEKEEERKSEEDDARKGKTNIGESIFGGTSSATAQSHGLNPFSTPSTKSGQMNPVNPFASLPATSTLAAKTAQRVEDPMLEQPSSQSATSQATPQQPSQPETSLPSTFAAAFSLNNPSPPPTHSATTTSPSSPASPQPRPYPSHHLDASYETLSPTPSPKYQTPTAGSLTEEDSSGLSSKDKEKESYESTHDGTFLRFADRLAQNPEQVLRYDFGGAPLLYSRDDEVGRLLTAPNIHPQSSPSPSLPPCTHCTHPRAFELQLTPHTIIELESEDEGTTGLEGMEWGTVIVGVCGQDCVPRDAVGLNQTGEIDGEVGYGEEWVGVQWEEREVRRKT
ncbi:MAG: hypothetical protein M1817_004251 [Caeruleum heppii]|nr:MAG: hypothetical protein M1817_004251 [Caeruleum heppii]